MPAAVLRWPHTPLFLKFFACASRCTGLDCTYTCQYNEVTVKFEWDPDKNSINREKHGCDLAVASEIFDHDRFEMRDDRKDYGEPRFIVIGLVNNRIMVAVFTTRGTDTIRIISLRKANNREKDRFEEALAKRLG